MNLREGAYISLEPGLTLAQQRLAGFNCTNLMTQKEEIGFVVCARS